MNKDVKDAGVPGVGKNPGSAAQSPEGASAAGQAYGILKFFKHGRLIHEKLDAR